MYVKWTDFFCILVQKNKIIHSFIQSTNLSHLCSCNQLLPVPVIFHQILFLSGKRSKATTDGSMYHFYDILTRLLLKTSLSVLPFIYIYFSPRPWLWKVPACWFTARTGGTEPPRCARSGRCSWTRTTAPSKASWYQPSQFSTSQDKHKWEVLPNVCDPSLLAPRCW